MPRVRSKLGFLIVAGLVESCLGGAGLALTLWLDEGLGVRPDVLGLILGTMTGAYIGSAILMGHLADRIGVRRMCYCGLFTIAAATLAMGCVTSPVWFVPLQVGRGLGAAMFWPPLVGWLGRGATRTQLPRRMAAFNIGWSSGAIAGTWLSGILYARFGAPVTFACYSASLLVGMVIVLGLPAPTSASPEEEGAGEDGPPAVSRVAAWAANFAAFYAISSVRTLFPQYGRLRLGLDPVAISTAVSLSATAELAAFVYLGLIAPHLASGGWLRRSPPAALLGLAALTVPSTPLALLGMLAVGFNGGVAYTASFYHSVYGRQDASRQGGIHEAVVASGAVLGAWVGGLAAQRIGLTAPWWIAATVVLAAWALAMGERRRRRSLLP